MTEVNFSLSSFLNKYSDHWENPSPPPRWYFDIELNFNFFEVIFLQKCTSYAPQEFDLAVRTVSSRTWHSQVWKLYELQALFHCNDKT